MKLYFQPSHTRRGQKFHLFFWYHQRNNRIIKNESHFVEATKKREIRCELMLVMKNVSTDFA